MARLIFGCGYLGGRVANLWRSAGHEVIVVTRSAAKAGQLAEQGFHPVVADVTRPETLKNLPEVETVLYSVGFDRSGGHTIEQVYAEGLRAALDALHKRPARVIYISTTGVYGQSDGRWVDEDSAVAPERAGGKASLAAESVLRAHALGERALILRLAGIYGPARIPRKADLLAGRPIEAATDGYLNLIHVEDAAAIVLDVEQRAALPRTYNVSDGNPVERKTYYEHLASLLGAPPPRFAAPPADSPNAQRASSDKRVSNARLMNEIAPKLRFPSYREGLAAIVASEPPPTNPKR